MLLIKQSIRKVSFGGVKILNHRAIIKFLRHPPVFCPMCPLWHEASPAGRKFVIGEV